MVAGNLGFTGELKTRLQTLKTWSYETPVEVYDPALRRMELESSTSLDKDITAEAVEILRVNSCQIVVLVNGSDFRCQAMHWNRSASAPRQSMCRDYYRAQNLLQRAILSDSPVLIGRNDPGVTPEERYQLRALPSENLLLIPIRIHTEPAGVFILTFHPMDLSIEQVKQALVLADQAGKALHREGLLLSDEVSIIELVMVLSEALRTWDLPTSQHCYNISALAEKTAIKFGCDFFEIQAVRRAALLHDIGKMGIPDQILQKPEKLTEREWAIMRQHPKRGADILRSIAGLADVACLVEAHHEHYDGSGYPYALKGDEIPLGARILSVVDAYTAITEHRVYRPARSHQEAIIELNRCSGRDFDPRVLKVFLSIINHHE